MIFPKELRMMDLALGLTTMCAINETSHDELDRIRATLEQLDHATIYARAQEIAMEYGCEIIAVEMHREEFRANWTSAFAYGFDTEGNIVCGLCTEDRQFLMPPIYPRDCIVPDMLTIIRARTFTRQ